MADPYLNPEFLNQKVDELKITKRESGELTGPTQEEIDTKGYNEAVFDSFGLDPDLITKGINQEAKEIGQHITLSAQEIWNQETGGKESMPDDFVSTLPVEVVNDILFEYEPSKTVRLNKAGISEEGLGLTVPRLIYEAGGLTDEIKKENLERYLKATNPDQSVTVLYANELGGENNKEFLEPLLGTDTLKELDYNPVLFKIGDGDFQVANKPGLDKGDWQFMVREIPVILTDVIGAYYGTKKGGLLGMASGSALGSFLGEGAVQAMADIYLTNLEGGEYTFDDFMERMEQASSAMKQQALFAGIATPVFKKIYDGIIGAAQRGAGLFGKDQRIGKGLRVYGQKADFDEAAERVSNKSIEELNTELTKLYGKEAPRIKLTLGQYFGDEFLVGIENFLKKNPKERKVFLDEVKANQKEAINAVNLYFEAAAGGVKAADEIPSIGQLGETVVGGAQKAIDDATALPGESAAFEISKLNTVLDAIEAGAQGQKIDNTFLDTLANTNRELFQTQKKELDLVINNTLATLPGGANAPFIKTGIFRREMYELNKALNKALVNADDGTIKLINEILEKTAGKKTPGKPGIAPAKELTFQEAMATLNGLNRLIDDDYARLAGGAADSNTITKVAAELRNSLNTSLEKSLSPENYIKLNTALTDLSNLRKQYNNEAINKLFKSAPNKPGLEISDKAVLSNILKDERTARELLGLLNNPSLTSQKDLVKNYIRQNYILEVTDGRQITDPGSLVKRTKKWLANNEALLDFFSPEERKLFNNATRFMKSADQSAKELSNIQAALKENGIERLGSVDPYTVNQFITSNPNMVNTLVNTLKSVDSNLATKTLNDIKAFYLTDLRNKIVQFDAFTGMNMYSSSAINQNILKSDKRGIYEALFGNQFINKLKTVSEALAPYESTLQGSFTLSPSEFEKALKNVFFGQLDRKRTLIRGIQNLLTLKGYKDIEIPLANVDEFFRRYKSHLNQPDWIRAAAAAGTQEPIVTGMSEEGELNIGELAGVGAVKGAATAGVMADEYLLQPALVKLRDIITRGGGSDIIQPK